MKYLKRNKKSLEKHPKPSWINKKTFKHYNFNNSFLPHVLRYNFAVAALDECELKNKQGYELTEDQKKKIDDQLKKERKIFIGWDIVGYIGLATNFGVFVPLLIQAITQPHLYQNLSLIWLSLINQIIWLIYAIGIRSMPLLVLSILLLPLMIVIVILVYYNLALYPNPQAC